MHVQARKEPCSLKTGSNCLTHQGNCTCMHLDGINLTAITLCVKLTWNCYCHKNKICASRNPNHVVGWTLTKNRCKFRTKSMEWMIRLGKLLPSTRCQTFDDSKWSNCAIEVHGYLRCVQQKSQQDGLTHQNESDSISFKWQLTLLAVTW